VSNFAQTAISRQAHSHRNKPPFSLRTEARRREGVVMRDYERYRVNAADCLLAAERCEPAYRKVHLSMALSWLSLARQDEAVNSNQMMVCAMPSPTSPAPCP
jgi:hypothetical protein